MGTQSLTLILPNNPSSLNRLSRFDEKIQRQVEYDSCRRGKVVIELVGYASLSRSFNRNARNRGLGKERKFFEASALSRGSSASSKMSRLVGRGIFSKKAALCRKTREEKIGNPKKSTCPVLVFAGR